ncbi:MAG: histidine phosphatase family protein [Candidatus Roizmanbacteria bacterium]|nr:histidine phosphatase family protein [Candidatus Roizmanbacteria bacterium]
MKLFLIRHGQSKGNIKPGFMSGRTDPEGLTHKGKIQVIRTAYELRNEKIDKIFVSPVARAQESSQILHRYFPKASIKTEEWLSELHHGVFEGFYWWEKIHKISPEHRKLHGEYTTPYPGGGESMQMMFERVSSGLRQYMQDCKPDAKVMLVSHQAPITAMRYMLKIGGPETLTTSTKQKAFMQYLHDVKLPNGGFAQASYIGKVLKNLDEVTKFDPVQEKKGNVEFYAKGVLDEDQVEAIKQETVSKHGVYHLKNSGDHLLKILHTENTKSVKRHVAIYSYLQEKGISAPLIIFHDDSHQFYKNDILVQDYAEGVVQDQCILEHPKQSTKVLAKIYDQLHAMFEIPRSEVKDFWMSLGQPDFQDWKPFMLYNINMTLHMIQGDVFQQKAIKQIEDTLKHLKTYIREGNYSLVPIHGDVAPGNIIISHGKTLCSLVRIIDFEWTRMGDKLWDLAYYWGWLERSNSEVASSWYDLLTEKLSSEQLSKLEWYRILFHAWTVRDMFEYEKDKIRQERGESSKEILNSATQLLSHSAW